MNCDVSKKLLSDLEQNKLDKERVHILKGHLTKCKECQGAYRKLVFGRILVKVMIMSMFALFLVFVLNKPVNRTELKRLETRPKVVSNVVIEIMSEDITNDTDDLQKLGEKFCIQQSGQNPVEIRVLKGNAIPFVTELSDNFTLPSDTVSKVADFIKVLEDSDEVVFKINFLEKE